LAIFRDLVKCPGRHNPPNNHIFVLDQDAVDPCIFAKTEVVAFHPWTANWNVTNGSLFLHDPGPPVVSYFACWRTPCAWRFWVNARHCPDDGARAGTAMVVPVNNSLAQIISQLYGLDPTPPGFYDSHSEDIDHTRFRLSRGRGQTRCNIQLDDEFVDFGWPLEE